jgi:hypothetical protein
MARTRMVQRWRDDIEVRDDADYVDTLTTLSETSVRPSFNPYTDIDWDSPEFALPTAIPAGFSRRAGVDRCRHDDSRGSARSRRRSSSERLAMTLRRGADSAAAARRLSGGVRFGR